LAFLYHYNDFVPARYGCARLVLSRRFYLRRNITNMPEGNDKPPRLGSTIPLTIESLAYGPYGVGRDRGRVVLVFLAAPGDEVEARLVSEKKSYATAELVRLIKPSAQRQPAPCPYVAQCGGCPWQHVMYRQQLSAKEAIVRENLRRIGRFKDFQLLPIVSSPSEYYYRRRIRLQCDVEKKVGFYFPFSHALVEIDACLIAAPAINLSLATVREWVRLLRTPLRDVEIVSGEGQSTAVLIGRSAAAFAGSDDALCASFLSRHPEIGGLVVSGQGWRRAWGEAKVNCYAQDLPLHVDADVFSQVNQAAAHRLVGELMSWGKFTGEDRVLELYCGAGNFTLPLARRAREVVAVEKNRLAVENGTIASKQNRFENVRWLCSDVVHAVRYLAREGERFTKIVLNPPRSGAKGIEGGLGALMAEKIFYVSCNPATLARDLAALSKKGYQLQRVQPFDLFPHTYHVETLVEMSR
jgi:23S rRNA (uracil1939-C5)-methyltransferase